MTNIMSNTSVIVQESMCRTPISPVLYNDVVYYQCYNGKTKLFVRKFGERRNGESGFTVSILHSNDFK